MKKSLFIFIIGIILNSKDVFAQNRINRYEYWFDNNFGSKTAVSVTPVNQLNLNTSFSTGSISDGIHMFSIRFRDDSMKWSSPVSGFFFKGGTGTDTQRRIVAWEYRVDLGSPVKTTLGTPVISFNLNTQLNLPSLSSGLHMISLRFLDQTGLWSPMVSQFFYKTENAGYTGSDSITLAEYWIDNNYSSAVRENLSPQNNVLFVRNMDFSGLPEGLHILTIRFRDGKGMYSVPVSSFFFKAPSSSVSNNLVDAYRYWFDDADTAITTVVLNTPVNPYELNAFFDMSKKWKGFYRIHFQFRDIRNNWSVVVTDTFEKKAHPLAKFNAGNRIFCDSGTVSFTNSSIDYDTVRWNFGDGTFSSESNPTHKYSTTGIYTVTLWVKDTASGLTDQLAWTDSIRVYATPRFSFGKDTAVCVNSGFQLKAPSGTGYKYKWQDASQQQNYTPAANGPYWCIVTGPGGCIWADTVNVTLKPLAKAKFGIAVNKNEVTFSDSSVNASTVRYRFGDGTSATSGNILHKYPGIGSYTAWMIVKNDCNTDSVSKVINITQTQIRYPGAENSFKVWPNPTDAAVTVECAALNEISEIRVMGSDGRDVTQAGSVRILKNSASVDLTALPAGVYHLVIRTEDGVKTAAVIKQIP